MKVCVVGLGYIGLPTAAMLAFGGHHVIGYDVDIERIDALRSGALVIKELAVSSLVNSALAAGLLTVTESIPEDAEAYIICVPTPATGHRPDLSYVRSATQSVATVLSPGNLVVLESTVPPNTTERVVVSALRNAGIDPDTVAITHCPERVTPGDIVRELRTNARVIGGRKSGDAECARQLYASFTIGQMYLTDLITAELVKVIENTYRDVNIAFANELALLSEELGVDAQEAIALANHHPRVDILRPGPGVGGHCIPVDPHFLSNANPFVTELIQASRRVNDRMPHFLLRRVMEFVPPRPGAIVAILGAAYKKNVDDTRESPTARLEELLHEHGYVTRVFDPIAQGYERPLAESLVAACRGAHAIVLMVDHDAFTSIDAALVGFHMEHRMLLDTRAFFDPALWEHAGFMVYTLGGRRHGRLAESAAQDEISNRRTREWPAAHVIREELMVEIDEETAEETAIV